MREEIRNEVDRILTNVDPNGLHITEDSRIYIKDMVQVLVQNQRKDALKKLIDKIEDNINEFGDNPKDALAIVSETIMLWLSTPEQIREYNEGHDY